MMRSTRSHTGLTKALDLDLVLALLRDSLPELRNGLDLRGVSVLDVRYRPDGPCWILYRLKLQDRRGHSVRQLAAARLLRPGEDPRPVRPEVIERYRARATQPLETPVAVIPDVPMVLYAFPLDAALPGMWDATDPDAMKRHFSRLFAPRDVRVRRVRVETLGYTPHARAAFRYEVLGEGRKTGAPELRRLIGKMHAKKPAAKLFANAWMTWAAGWERIGLAPPVGYVSEIGLTLQEQVRGERLGGLVAEPRFTRHVRRTARMLGALHSLSLPLTTRRKVDDEIHGVHRWSGVLMAIRPDLARRVEKMRDRLTSELRLRCHLSAPIHADFHHTNILVDGDRITLIDFDEMAFGDPMVDVGRFLASLRVPARRAFGDIAALSAAGEAFLDTYLTHHPGEESRARLFEAASLLIAAGSSFRIQRENWQEEVALLLAESERILELAGVGKAASAGDGTARPGLTGEEQERWALDPLYMQAALDPHLRTAFGAYVTRCRVRQRDPEAGDRLTYEVKGRLAGEPWSVTLRGERRPSGGHRLVGELSRLGAALVGTPQAPVLPRPVAYLRALSLIVWDPPDGVSLCRMIDEGDSTRAVAGVEALALALATVHSAEVSPARERDRSAELIRLRRRLGGLADQDTSGGQEFAPLVREIEQRLGESEWPMGPAFGTVNPHHVLWSGGRIRFARIDQIVWAHPFGDAGDFLARLKLHGLQHGHGEAIDHLSQRFREVYGETIGHPESHLATFEAAALLRLAASRAVRTIHGALVGRLLDGTRRRLAA